jgi:hypothetical protein
VTKRSGKSIIKQLIIYFKFSAYNILNHQPLSSFVHDGTTSLACSSKSKKLTSNQFSFLASPHREAMKHRGHQGHPGHLISRHAEPPVEIREATAPNPDAILCRAVERSFGLGERGDEPEIDNNLNLVFVRIFSKNPELLYEVP